MNAVAAARWLIGSLIARCPLRMMIAGGSALVVACLQASVLFVAQAELSGQGIASTMEAYLPFATTKEPAVVIAIAMVGVVALSGIFGFVSGQQILIVWRRYQAKAVDDVLDRVSLLAQKSRVPVTERDLAPFTICLRRSQRLGAGTRIILNALAPAVRLTAFLGYAVWAHPVLTLFLGGLVIPAGGLSLFMFGRRAARDANRAINLAHDASRELKQSVEAASRGESLEKSRPSEAGPFYKKTSSVISRLRRVEEAKLASTLLASGILAALVGAVFIEVSADRMNWSDGWIYIIAMVLTLLQLNNVVSSLSTFGRFYPSFLLQKTTVDILARADSLASASDEIRRSGILGRSMPETPEDDEEL